MATYDLVDIIQIASFLFSIVVFLYSVVQIKKTEKFSGYTRLIEMSNELFRLTLDNPELENPSITMDKKRLLELDSEMLRKYVAFVNMRLGFCEQILFFKNKVKYIDDEIFYGIFEPLIDAMVMFHIPMVTELLEFYNPDLQEYLQNKYHFKIERDVSKKDILNKAQPLPGEE